MTSLEQIVLPLAESRALAEKVKLDTVFSWAAGLYDSETAAVWTECAKKDLAAMRDYEHRHPDEPDTTPWPEPIPAPTLSELLDAIRAKGYGDIRFDWNLSVPSERRCMAIVANSTNGEHHAYGATDLLAAASLLLEVAK